MLDVSHIDIKNHYPRRRKEKKNQNPSSSIPSYIRVLELHRIRRRHIPRRRSLRRLFLLARPLRRRRLLLHQPRHEAFEVVHVRLQARLFVVLQFFLSCGCAFRVVGVDLGKEVGDCGDGEGVEIFGTVGINGYTNTACNDKSLTMRSFMIYGYWGARVSKKGMTYQFRDAPQTGSSTNGLDASTPRRPTWDTGTQTQCLAYSP